MDPMTIRRVQDRVTDLQRAAAEERLAREARAAQPCVETTSGRATMLGHLRAATGLGASPTAAGARTRA